MIVSTDRLLFTPEVFAYADTIRAAAKSTKEGLNIDSGLGGSFSVEFVAVAAEGTLTFVRKARPDWPEQTYRFSPFEASRAIYACHPSSPWQRERRLPLGAIACMYCRHESIVKNAADLMPEGTTTVTLTSPIGSLTKPVGDLVRGTPAIEKHIADGLADVRRNHPSLANYPICFVAFTNDLMEAGRASRGPLPFTFDDLAYKLRCTTPTF